ncbi:hypothetical protein DFA_02031 [Cavenderia fasciculata]|uniref:Uncharacterized protein n=1 Tax=Cavenderia fasciculata TaxID=261658 RepID=F4PYI0_CACFS|nr:uncharacterized protein DFA_02031 [Cavenderia fasciculata]EGG19246.1 hypothetical protein DFA_02031 [Cavenderia fasciculata]|eukprot:XP_004357517.1 hypothetical protein DFA_02031 [Cavenderia fasciculata]
MVGVNGNLAQGSEYMIRTSLISDNNLYSFLSVSTTILTKINNVIVEPIKLPQPPKNVKGSELFNQLNANILVCAPKNSGKTVVIKKIIDECTNKQTNVLIFCATVHNDHSWLEIQKDLDKRGITFMAFTSIYDDKANVLEAFVQSLQVKPNEKEIYSFATKEKYHFLYTSRNDKNEGRMLDSDCKSMIFHLIINILNPGAKYRNTHIASSKRTILSSFNASDIQSSCMFGKTPADPGVAVVQFKNQGAYDDAVQNTIFYPLSFGVNLLIAKVYLNRYKNQVLTVINVLNLFKPINTVIEEQLIQQKEN